MIDISDRSHDGDTILRVSQDKRTFIVEEHRPGGVVSRKEILPPDFYHVINSSFTDSRLIASGLLPANCLHVSIGLNGKRFVLWNHELTADISYYGTDYPGFPIPRLVFGVRMLSSGKVASCTLGVVADEAPKLETPMFCYPFSNVSGFHVCVGNNVMPTYKKQQALKNFPRYILGLPDSGTWYESSNNKLMLAQRDLLEHLKNKDTAYYYTDVLVPSGKTLGDFIEEEANND